MVKVDFFYHILPHPTTKVIHTLCNSSVNFFIRKAAFSDDKKGFREIIFSCV